MSEPKSVTCYNRGCGKNFDPDDNDKDDCQHHPGLPFFHDAYKGWSCCKKKSVDFTEFLNYPGCTFAKHSNVKPEQPEKKTLDKELDNEIKVVKAPITPVALQRPTFESSLVIITPKITEPLKQQIQKPTERVNEIEDGTITIGTACKNGGCQASYQGPQSNDEGCTHHPGCPIFHEGLKFWSCCQKRTTDFNVFLNQPGCTSGNHKWTKDSTSTGVVKCRWDWHQTSSNVIISIYAKKYDTTRSYVKLNPIRFQCKLIFPEEGDRAFELDLELRGIISIEQSTVTMAPSKVEIQLKKAEPGSWSNLDFPRENKNEEKSSNIQKETPKSNDYDDDLVDLSEVEATENMYKVNISDMEKVE